MFFRSELCQQFIYRTSNCSESASMKLNLQPSNNGRNASEDVTAISRPQILEEVRVSKGDSWKADMVAVSFYIGRQNTSTATSTTAKRQ